MKAASLKELKTELSLLPHAKVVEHCMRLTKYKKDNKELLSYLLFEAGDEANFIKEVKLQMDEEMDAINITNSYLAKKTIRKVLRTANKFIKYSGLKQTEVELLMHFCFKMKASGIAMPYNSVLGKLYQRQIMRLGKALLSLHEDLQYDYGEEMKGL